VQESLQKLHQRASHRFLSDDVDGAHLPETNWKDTTDAHLVYLASRHGLKLATLDETLIKMPWASGIAENPLRF